MTIRMASILEPSKFSFFPTMTKIVGTLGPKSRSVEVISSYLKAGMSVARFDFSWGDIDYHQQTLENFKMAIKSTKKLCTASLHLRDTVAHVTEQDEKTRAEAAAALDMKAVPYDHFYPSHNNATFSLDDFEDLITNFELALAVVYKKDPERWKEISSLLRGYIGTSISDGPGCLMLRCPDPSCGAAVGEDMINKIAITEDKEKYSRNLVRSYIEDNRKMRIIVVQ